jgi:hypothetical protein
LINEESEFEVDYFASAEEWIRLKEVLKAEVYRQASISQGEKK